MKLKKERKSFGPQMIEIGILLMIANFMTAIFIWQSIISDWKIADGGRFFFHALVQKQGPGFILGLDQAGAYIGFLNVLFSLLGNKEELVLVTNLIFQILGVFLFYGGARYILGSVPACLFALASAVCSVISFPVNSDVPMHITWFILSFFFFLFARIMLFKREKGILPDSFVLLALGGVCGMLIFYDITGIFILTCLFMFRLTVSGRSDKERFIDILYLVPGAAVVFILLIFKYFSATKPILLGMYDWYGKRMEYYQQNNIMWKEFLSISILFFLYFCMNLVFLFMEYRKNMDSIRLEKAKTNRNREAVAEEEAKIKNTEEKIVLEEEAKIKNTEEKIVLEEEAKIKNTEKKAVPRLEAVAGKESTIEGAAERSVQRESTQSEEFNEKGIKTEVAEKKKTVRLLENPLPLPRKHVKKEMMYGFEPSQDQMHYDLNNYDVNDDYDLK